MTSLIKNLHTQPKNFFQVISTRLAVSCELLTGSVAFTGPEKFPRKATCDYVTFSRKSLKAARRKRVEIKFS